MKFLYIILIIFISCSDKKIESEENLWNAAKNYRLTKDYKNSITSFKKIIENYPNGSYSIESKFQIADIYLNDIKDYDFALQNFNEIVKYNTKHPLEKKALFMIGYINSNYLDSYTDAINAYSLFIDKYPKDELIPSVEYELDLLKNYSTIIDSLNMKDRGGM